MLTTFEDCRSYFKGFERSSDGAPTEEHLFELCDRAVAERGEGLRDLVPFVRTEIWNATSEIASADEMDRWSASIVRRLQERYGETGDAASR